MRLESNTKKQLCWYVDTNVMFCCGSPRVCAQMFSGLRIEIMVYRNLVITRTLLVPLIGEGT